eukprot:6451365-Prymnesium_polylepis.1
MWTRRASANIHRISLQPTCNRSVQPLRAQRGACRTGERERRPCATRRAARETAARNAIAVWGWPCTPPRGASLAARGRPPPDGASAQRRSA